MADERPEDRNGRERRDQPVDPSPGGAAGRDDGQSRRNGRHGGFKGRRVGRPAGAPSSIGPRESGRQPSRDDQGQRFRGSRPEDARDMPACPLCGKPIYDLSTAISASRDAGDPAHFDCVFERVNASESLVAGEKLVYLGSGAFGVVEYKDKDKSESAFSVKRRIQWEKEGEKKDWRRLLSSRISNL